ncbi:MAG: hypothetical protein ACR5LD_10190 [Symbiopectobacterium sp.]
MLPSFIVIMSRIRATRVLMLSQVLLSFGIALALVPFFAGVYRKSGVDGMHG